MAPSLTRNALHAKGHADGHVASIVLEGARFFVNGHPVLTEVPVNVKATPSPLSAKDTTKVDAPAAGCFLGFDVVEPKSRHVVPIGKFSGIRFTSIFRFKPWWSTHWGGNSGRDLEYETQMLLLDKSNTGRPYVFLLPLLEGPFRASLQAGTDDYVDICVESGSTQVSGSSFSSCLYMHAGDDPYGVVKEAMKVARVHLGTFRLLEEKTPPGVIDKFGWCTWDAFYRKVDPKGILEGVKGLVEGGCPPGVVLIDDGWQSISIDDDPIGKEGIDRATVGEDVGYRLLSFKENYKFGEYESTKEPSNKGMGAFIKDLKEEFKTIKYVYVWQALCGNWGGVRPNVPGMPEATVIPVKLSEGLQTLMDDFATTNVVRDGIGLVPPELAHQFFEGLHSHLASVGIDGVKIDVIQILEMLAEEYGGCVELEKAYYEALSASVKKNFKGNGVIASMEQCNDFFFLGTEAVCLGRVGDDFWCIDPYGDPRGMFWLQGCHVVHCAYNSLWMGNFIHPDWDMFQTTHPCAEFHAASRAISGGPIYISDSAGKHNFKLLKSLALPDGSILRCQNYALPTRDCLFEDPLHDGKTMLKIWNLNKYSGVLGVFNCQGGGWNREARQIIRASEFSRTVGCFASPMDIEWGNGESKPISVDGVDVFVVYMHRQRKLKLMKPSETIGISHEPLNYEILTVSPVTVLASRSIEFAPIGLVNMFNSGGAVQSLDVEDEGNLVRIGVKGEGEMRVFASEKPKTCKIDGVPVEFGYDDDGHMVRIQVPWPSSPKLSVIEYLF